MGVKKRRPPRTTPAAIEEASVRLVSTVYGALRQVFESPTEKDRGGEDANVVDGLYAIARALDRLATTFATAASVAHGARLEARDSPPS